MSHLLIIRKRAENQLAEAFAWYENQRTGLGHEFLDSVEATLAFVENQPLLFQVKHKNIHCALTPRFPYGIFYFIEDDKIIVIGVFHLSRNPKRWKK